MSARVCPECRRANPAGNRFCGSCGASLEGAKLYQEVEAEPTEIEPAPPPPWRRRSRRRSRRWLWAAAFAVLISLVLCANLVGRSGNGTPTPTPAQNSASAGPTDADAPTRTPIRASTKAATRRVEPAATKRKPTRTPRPTATSEPTTEPYAMWKEHARDDILYKMVEKSDAYRLERVCWRGEIFAIEEEDGMTAFQAWYYKGKAFDGLEDGWNAFVVLYEGVLPDVFNEDEVEVCGYLGDKLEGTNAFGATVVQPMIAAVYVNKR